MPPLTKNGFDRLLLLALVWCVIQAATGFGASINFEMRTSAVRTIRTARAGT